MSNGICNSLGNGMFPEAPPAPGNGGHQVEWPWESLQGPTPPGRRMLPSEPTLSVPWKYWAKGEGFLTYFCPGFQNFFFFLMKIIHIHGKVFGTFLKNCIHLKSLLNLLQYCFYFMFCFLAKRHVGSCSLTRNWTCTPCVGRQNLNHWSTRKVPRMLL